MRKSLTIALLGAVMIADKVLAAESTRFTKVVGEDGVEAKFVTLSKKTYLAGVDKNTLLEVSKLRLDPRKMQLDLADSTFAEAALSRSIEGDSNGFKPLIDLTGTLFTFIDGSKQKELNQDEDARFIDVVVDNEALLDKY